jgi:DNA-binding transcriptional regulator YhcF (GntR family)
MPVGPRRRTENELELALDRSGDVPIGVQLVWNLRSMIVAGTLPAGHRLPGVRDLAQAVGVNANTVRAVYARLEAEGLLTAEHGRGTFVARDAAPDLRLAVLAVRAADEARAMGADPREVAAALYVQTGAPTPVPAVPEEPPAAAEESEGVRRRRLRDEIAGLEYELADLRLAGLTPMHADDPAIARPEPGEGRILSTSELEALRDELSDRLTLLRGARDKQREERRRERAESATNTLQQPAARERASEPRGRWTITPAPGHWTLKYS